MKTILALWVLVPTLVFAQADELENPGTISAIQDRAFRMTHELDLSVGWLPIDAFWKGYDLQFSYAYHFTDHFAWQVGRGAYSYNVDTGLRSHLETVFGVLPTAFDEVQYFVGSDAIWTPFYGKTSLLNKTVLYFDSHLILGASIFKFTNSNFRPAINIGGGIRLHQNRYVSYRLDITDNVIISDKPLSVLAVQLMLALNFGSGE